MPKKGYKHPKDCGHCAWSRLPKPERQKRKTAETLRGHEVPVEVRAKIAETLKARDYSGERSGSWTGDAVSRGAMHQRMQKVLPHECALADDTCKGVLDVSYRHDVASIRRESPMGPWSPLADDYWRLCRSHHRRYDRVTEGRKRDERGRLAPS